MRLKLLILFLLASCAPIVLAQQPSKTDTGPDNPSEAYKLQHSCFEIKGIMDCAEELFTGQPVHIAVGSIAPQNGFAAGLAYVGHKTTPNWRTTWDADAVASENESWRAGVYLKLVDTKEPPRKPEFGTKGRNLKPNLTALPERPVINLYVQTITLNKLTYFGLGPSTTEAGRSFYGMRQTIVGASAVKPFYAKLSAAFYGEMNGRFVDIRPSLGQPSPTIGALYTEATAPGLTNQPGTVQFGEGVRMRPVWFDDFLHLDYNLTYQQYVAPGNSSFTFQHLTTDLSHQFAIWRKTTRIILPRDTNGPDECSVDRDSENAECSVDKFALHHECLNPQTAKSAECKEISRDLQGSFGLRVYSALSMTPGGNVVPFYFQPTLGGSDINGNQSLSSYQDFRFRAPNVLLIRENFEQSIFSLPIGVAFMADEGKVGLSRGDLGSNPWLHSFSAGLTLRAGGFPQVFLLFSWGGKEGTHTIANVNTSLLGGSARPSLY
ncbi:MAG TPA: hypothetical protein VEI73_15910 [Candidatus Acidoferrum sp.]|nr:hypothetical protein [Candidatus Acidoferrum sp.]